MEKAVLFHMDTVTQKTITNKYYNGEDFNYYQLKVMFKTQILNFF